MAKKYGPFLAFRGISGDQWTCSAIVIAPEPLNVAIAGTPIAHEELWQVGKLTVFRYLLTFPLRAAASIASYTVEDTQYEVAVPALGLAPRIAYASCNGFSSLKLLKSVKDRNSLWRSMAAKHGLVPKTEEMAVLDPVAPYNLLMLGGDQVYADSMWETVPSLMTWNSKGWEAGNKAKLTATMIADLESFYFNLYLENWSHPEVAAMMARVPSIAMWDDHDLIDGWGSYPPERQNCPVYRGIWSAASKAFAVFQQHIMPGVDQRPDSISSAPADWWLADVTQGERTGSFSFGYRIGDMAIVAADMRSQRTAEGRVISREHWDEIYQWIDRLEGVKHLLFMSSIPVVYPGFDLIERALGLIPGHQDLEDDLRDHWNSPPHKAERVRLIHRLLKISETKGIRTTLVSGDVHVGALGLIESTQKSSDGMSSVVVQLISSGIVHPGPGGIVLYALQHLFGVEDPIDTRISSKMIPFPGSDIYFLGIRNYLSIEPDPNPSPRLWCNWIGEGEKFVRTKVIDPLG